MLAIPRLKTNQVGSVLYIYRQSSVSDQWIKYEIQNYQFIE